MTVSRKGLLIGRAADRLMVLLPATNGLQRLACRAAFAVTLWELVGAVFVGRHHAPG